MCLRSATLRESLLALRPLRFPATGDPSPDVAMLDAAGL